ncbi:glycosyltransferase family 2 protein [Haloplanus rallus]|uniref:Glycosyltransferase family 2 protein n=1 Tax=Haloplanus rallus TaxID=1816183 RepID=A0A6B9FCZ7_9EURY|nr:glycosyltransferase family 2 protein [Haloplanus rallus]QGX96471.1 glycosyltransferase family 2 protein [Haloplanus rallus]
MTELASIIITTYYRNEWLRLAIKSAINQTYENVETIVVDDSGERHAENVVSDYDVTYIPHDKNRGANPARNTGFQASSGKYIQFLDDDDQLLPEKIERHVEIIRENEDVGVAYCGFFTDEKEGRTDGTSDSRREVHPKPDVRGDVLEQALRMSMHPCIPSTMLIERSVLKSIMPLTPRPARDGIDIRLLLANKTRFEYSDELLLERGIHEDHRGEKPEAMPDMIRVVKDYKEIYDAYDPQIRYQRLETVYRMHSRRLLDEKLWSPQAILSSLKALYWMSKQSYVNVVTVALVFAAVFGKPGYRIASSIYNSTKTR